MCYNNRIRLYLFTPVYLYLPAGVQQCTGVRFFLPPTARHNERAKTEHGNFRPGEGGHARSSPFTIDNNYYYIIVTSYARAVETRAVLIAVATHYLLCFLLLLVLFFFLLQFHRNHVRIVAVYMARRFLLSLCVGLFYARQYSAMNV